MFIIELHYLSDDCSNNQSVQFDCYFKTYGEAKKFLENNIDSDYIDDPIWRIDKDGKEVVVSNRVRWNGSTEYHDLYYSIRELRLYE